MASETQSRTQEVAWARLMSAAQQGDAVCYEQLLRGITPFIRSLSRRYCRNPQLTEDVVQDVLLTVHRAANNESGALRAVEAIEPLLAALPERQRLALEAIKIRGLSLAQAASESGQSVGALKVNVHRAVKALRTLVSTVDKAGEE